MNLAEVRRRGKGKSDFAIETRITEKGSKL